MQEKGKGKGGKGKEGEGEGKGDGLVRHAFGLAAFAGIEAAFNVFPSTPRSSLLLLGCHLGVLAAVATAPFDAVEKTKEKKG